MTTRDYTYPLIVLVCCASMNRLVALSKLLALMPTPIIPDPPKIPVVSPITQQFPHLLMARRAHLGLHLTAVDPALLPIARTPRPPPTGFAPAEHLELLRSEKSAAELPRCEGMMRMVFLIFVDMGLSEIEDTHK